MADLDLRIKQTVKGCQWGREHDKMRMIDLLYHATIYYEICMFVQESNLATLTYEMVIEKAKAHERNVLEYKDHQASHGGANSAPSYNDPLLSAHALSKRWPSGRGNNGQRCGKCGKSHERGNCPAYGKSCNRCKGINHFQAVCRSKVAAKTGQSPHRSKKSQPQRRGSTGSYNGHGKGGGKKKKTPKKPPKQNAYAVMMKNSVPSEVTTTSGGERNRVMIWEQLASGRVCRHLLRNFMGGTWRQGRKLRETSKPSILCCRRDSWRWCWITTWVGEPRRQGRWWWVKGAMS